MDGGSGLRAPRKVPTGEPEEAR